MSKLVSEVANPHIPTCIRSLPDHPPQDPRDWGLKHEETAQSNYRQAQQKQHHKLELESTGFTIFNEKPFIGASVDDICHCSCEKGCPSVVVVEHKCPPGVRDVLTPKNSAVLRSRTVGAGVLIYFVGAGAKVCSPPVKLQKHIFVLQSYYRTTKNRYSRLIT